MTHVTETTPTNAQAKPRRSSRPKASKEQLAQPQPVNQENLMTTSTAAAEATFADVGDAAGTPATAAAPQGKTTDTADKAKVTYLRVFVLATTAAGSPEFFTTIVGATDEELAGKKHLDKATRKAAVEGYRWPMRAFDQSCSAARQLEVLAGRQLDAMSRA